MNAIIQSPFFGIFITFICYEIVMYLKKYIKSPLFNSVVIPSIIIMIILKMLNISYDAYNKSASFLTALLLPATTILAIHIYRQREILKKYWLPIVMGCIAGAITSIVSVITLSNLFKVDHQIIQSMIPKSITTAIAIDVSSSLGGIVSITIISVIITGMVGAVLAPVLIKLFKFDDAIVQGCAIGCASHALGTTKAIELGEIQAAIASVAIIITGIATVFITLFL